MKVTIFGLAGTGTSTAGKALAKALGYQFRSSGDMFRARAAELGMSLIDFDRLCDEDPEHDKALDAAIAAFGAQNENIVVESRLAWHFIPDSFKVKLVCDHEERMHRVAKRDNITLEEAKAQTLIRETAGPKRYKEYYGIDDYLSDEHFDLVIDTTHTPVEGIIEQIRKVIGV